nr:YfhO family protein [Lachnospiraceae bacterium]
LAAWAKEADRANKNMGEVNEIASSHLSFEAGTDEGDIIIASVPYDSAWKVKCDGKKAETMPVMGMLMGIKIPEGQHSIDMRYVPNGTIPGIIVSLLGIALFAAGIIYDRKRNKTTKII